MVPLPISVKNMEINQEVKQESKKELRKRMLGHRDNLSEVWRKNASIDIIEKVISLPIYQHADAVFSYVSYRSEVETDALIEKALTDGKAVYCPKVIRGMQTPCMEFYQIFTTKDLETGFRGIREPISLPARRFGVSKEYVQRAFGEKAVILFLMPGAVFDKDKHRIGYGGGYYDSYLERCKVAGIDDNMTKIALAYSTQLVEAITPEAHDIMPQLLITEE